MIGHAPISYTELGDESAFRAKLWWLSLLGYIGTVLVGIATAPGYATSPAAWLPPVIAFTWLTLDWNGTIPAFTRRLWTTVACIAGITVVLTLAFGSPVLAALRITTGLLLQAILQALIYRCGRGLIRRPPRGQQIVMDKWSDAWRAQWTPTGARDAAILLVASIVPVLLVMPIGTAPGWWLSEMTTSEAYRWLFRSIAVLFVGGVGIMLVFQTFRRQELQTRHVWQLVPLFALSVVLLHVALSERAFSLSWLVLIPAIYAGLVLTPWAVSVHTMLFGITALYMSTMPLYAKSFEQADIEFSILVTISSFVAVTLSLLTQSRSQALSQLEGERSAAAAQNQLLRTIFNTMNDGLIVLDRKAAVAMSNTSARHILGKPVPEVASEDWVDYFGLKTLDGNELKISDMPGFPGRELDSTSIQVDNEGSRRILDVGSWPINSPDEQHTQLLLFTDKTAEHERVENLTRFAGTVAHDLRSPLTGLEGWLELAEDALLAGQSDDALLMLRRSLAGTGRMKQVIQDWLGYSVTRDGVLQPTRVELKEVVKDVIAPFRSELGEGAEIAVDVDHAVESDPAMTRQLIANLVSNAVKYTKPGERPVIRVRSFPAAEPGQIQVEVVDRGPGIPPGEEKAIFEEFRRSSRHEGDDSGTGLGLSLCMRIVHRHGGRMWVHNNPSGGATFAFTLPEAA